MRTKFWLFSGLTALIFSLVIISCDKEFSSENGLVANTTGTGSMLLPAATPVTGSVAGVVVDENNTPVSNAAVTVSGTTYFTDSKGFFNTQKLALDKYITTVTVVKQGYFTSFRTFSANPAKNYVSIKLIPKILAGSFSSTGTGMVALPNGTQISFQANSMNIKSTGAAYSGQVNVYASYIDPSAGDISAKVPGSFLGTDAGRIYCLASTGMIAVELESASGEPLQLAGGKTAAMKLFIPADLQSLAPANIPTWSLDARGIWVKEGSAVKNGNYYDLQVSHFSFWNCDVPINAIYLSLNIKDQDNNNLTNSLIQLRATPNSGYGSAYGYTDSLGNVSGMVPANNVLALSVYSSPYTCNNPLNTQNIGPFAVNTSLNVAVTLTPQQILTVTGSATDCNSAPVTNGTAIIYGGVYNVYYTSIVNGNFSIDIPHCGPITQIDVIAIDMNTMQQSQVSTVPVSGNSVNTGVLNACGTAISQFMNYTMDGMNYVILASAPDSIGAHMDTATNQATNVFAAKCNVNCDIVSLSVQGAAVGTFPISGANFISSQFTHFIFNPQPNATVTFSTYGNVGQFVEGSFNIPFVDSSVSHTCTGSFRVRRYL